MAASRRHPFTLARLLRRRSCRVASAEHPGHDQAEQEKERGWHQGAAEDVLRVDDAHGERASGIGRLGMGAQHGVAQQDQDQRGRDDDAECAGDADQRRAVRRRHAALASLGATLRASMVTLAPTEPFIGASRAPSPRVASDGAVLERPPSATPQRNSRSASGKWLSSAPIST